MSDLIKVKFSVKTLKQMADEIIREVDQSLRSLRKQAIEIQDRIAKLEQTKTTITELKEKN